MTRSFNPFELDNPVLNLGEHGSYELGDVTRSRYEKLVGLFNELDALEFRLYESIVDDGEGEEKVEQTPTDIGDEQASVIAKICEAACTNADGLAEKIVTLYKEQEIGRNGLRGAYAFVMEWVRGNETAGEG